MKIILDGSVGPLLTLGTLKMTAHIHYLITINYQTMYICITISN